MTKWIAIGALVLASAASVTSAVAAKLHSAKLAAIAGDVAKLASLAGEVAK